MSTLRELIALLERWFDPSWAESWDTVGLVSGDPGATISSVHVAVDPTLEVVGEAIDTGASLLLTHHPLWLGGTTTVGMHDAKGRIAGALARAGCSLYVAHTNADVASPGVSDALCAALGVREPVPLRALPDLLDRWVVHVPASHTEQVLRAMADAGAGRMGDYERCAFVGAGEGTFRPLPGATPHTGHVGGVARVPEDRLEMVAAPAARNAVGAAIRAAHPYEEPSMTVVDASTPSRRGLGRMGSLVEPLSLREFCLRVSAALPATASGVRASGNPAGLVSRIAVAGGACMELAPDAAAAGADVLVTSDARHHRTQESPIPVVDISHWAGEWPFTVALADRLRAAVPGLAATASHLVTDPWTLHVPDGVGLSV